MIVPSKIVIVEDFEDRVEFLLKAIVDDNSLEREGHVRAANSILNNCLKKKNPEEYDFTKYQFKKNDKVIIILPTHDKNFERIERIFTMIKEDSAVCFIDFNLENDDLNRLAEEKIRNTVFGTNPGKALYAGVYICELFQGKFGRLLVSASSTIGDHGLEVVSSFYSDSTSTAGQPGGARRLLEHGLRQYNDSFGLHKVPEIARLLFFIESGVMGKWDYPLEPFSHDSLNTSSTEHFKMIIKLLDCEGKDLDEGAGFNSAKGLFMVPSSRSNSPDYRKISKTALGVVCRTLGIPLEDSLPEISWIIQHMPGIALLLALKNFLHSCGEEGEIPKVLFVGNESKTIEERINVICYEICLTFADSCENLITVYESKSNNDEDRPESGVSLAFYNLLRSNVDVRSEIEIFTFLSTDSGKLKYFVDRNFKKISLTWKVEVVSL